MLKHYKYAIYLFKHKWFVFIEAVKLGIPWLGIIHDMSKFRPDEWRPYAEFFYGKKAKTGTGDYAFDFAWLLHQKRNKHHWQWWCLPEDDGGLKVLNIPYQYRREMLADWRGIDRAQGRSDTFTLAWYMKNKDKMSLNPYVREWLDYILGAPKDLAKE